MKMTSYPANTFCWVDLATSDAAEAKEFYGDLFGWTAVDMPTGIAIDPLTNRVYWDNRESIGFASATFDGDVEVPTGRRDDARAEIDLRLACDHVDRRLDHRGKLVARDGPRSSALDLVAGWEWHGKASSPGLDWRNCEP